MRPSTISGIAGRAWKIEVDPLKIKQVDHTACLSMWLLNVPGAHILWSYWAMGLVHLRDIPGQTKPPHKTYPEAGFELFIYSIDPQKCPQPDPDRADEGYPMLMPLDLQYQFHGVTDEVAEEITDLAAKYIMAGQLSPDQDYRQIWKHVLDNTVEHFRTGHRQ